MSDINKLTVLFNDTSGASFTDLTQKMFEYGRDGSGSVAIETADYLYLGRDKPFNTVYVEMDSIPNAIASVLSAEYYDATDAAWTALPLLAEETQGASATTFSRSGVIKWDKGIDSDDWGTVAINGTTQYWVRFAVSVNVTPTMAFKGINVLFSDDEDLKRYHPSILKMLSRDENDTVLSSFVLAHEAARDQIMLELNKAGISKTDLDTGISKPLDHWDVHEVGQVRLASTHKALEIIFSDNSDVEGDQYDQKARKHEAAYKEAISGVIIELDLDDDGFVSSDEQGKTISTTLSR